MTSQTLIFDYIKKILETQLIDGRPTYRNENYIFSNRNLTNIENYLNKIAPQKQKEILSIVKEFNINQKALFFENLKISAESSRKPELLLRDVKEIRKGIFQKRMLSFNNDPGCLDTYIGFMRALKSETLYSTKVNIGGKLKRVFVKTPIGYTENFPQIGFSKLMIDPETMNVYSFLTTEDGKIITKSIRKAYSKENLKSAIIGNEENQFAKDFVLKSYDDFRKELLNRIDAVYGIERIVDTYLRMGGKINPEKYSKIKEELIEHMKEKFGTEKLLNWVSKVKDPKESAKLKLEILEHLSKKHGDLYKQYFKTEFVAVRKELNKGKISRFIPKIRPKKPL